MLKYLFCLVIIATHAYAQPLRPGEWRAYTAMTSVTSLAATQDSNAIWVATSGGAFRVDLADVNAEKLALRTLDGLSTNELTAVTVDPDGTVYLGGIDGSLAIYTPPTGNVHSIQDIVLSTLITKKTINRITVVGNRVYIAANYGISIYDRAQQAFSETITKFASLPAQDTAFSVMEISGKIYVALRNAVAVADRNSPQLSAPFAWQLYTAPQGVSLRTLSVANGKIVAAGFGGAFVLEGDSLRRLPLVDTALIFDAAVENGKLFLLDKIDNGRLITTTDLSEFTFASIERSAPEDVITALSIAGQDKLAFGSSTSGATVKTAEIVEWRIFPDGPISNDMFDMYFSRATGKLYISHAFSGISSFNAETSGWINYSTNAAGTKLPRHKYEKIFYDSIRSVLWASTFGSGLMKCMFDGDALDSVERMDGHDSIPPSDPGNPAFVVVGQSMLDSKGNLIVSVWAANGQGIARTSDGITFEGISLSLSGSQYRPWRVIAEDLEGFYYVGTALNTTPPPFGVCYVPPQGSQTLPGAIQGGQGQILSTPNVNALVVDQDNNLWCGTTEGVEVVSHFRSSRTGLLEFRARKLPFPGTQVVQAIAVDGVGNKWIGTENGVFVVSPDGSDSLAHYTTENSPLLDNAILALTVDGGSGEVYIATSKGISRTSSIYKEGNPDYTTLHVYPNPVIRSRDERPTITIAGLVSGSTIKIYTVSGKLIKTIDASSLGSTATWDGRDENGDELSSGVYILGATSELATESGQAKFVLVRK